jgi:hypothetical protein
MADILSEYGIEPSQQRIAGIQNRGYARSAFEDAWKRYLAAPPEPVTAVTPVKPTAAAE